MKNNKSKMQAVIIKIHYCISILTTSRKLKVNGSTRLNCEVFSLNKKEAAHDFETASFTTPGITYLFASANFSESSKK